MTPEALHAYLIGKGIDEDAAQDVLVSYLTAKVPIRYPKSWAWKSAVLRRGGKQSQNASVRCMVPLTPAMEAVSATSEPSPLKLAEVRQALARAIQALPSDEIMDAWHKGSDDKRRHLKVYPTGRPKGGGVEGWQEDYRALLDER